VVPPKSVDKTDGSINTNTTVSEVVIAPAPGDEGSTFILGRRFFSTTYLSVNYDDGTFTLWEANPTDDADLVSFGPECSSSLGDSASPKDNDNEHSGSENSNQVDSQETLSAGAIAGIVIGAVLVAMLIAGLMIFCYIRRRRLVKEGEIDMPEQKLNQYQPPSLRERSEIGFNEAMSAEVQEMTAQQDPHELLAQNRPQELSSEKAARVRQVRMLQGFNSPVELG
jgi:hypothetical protein